MKEIKLLIFSLIVCLFSSSSFAQVYQTWDIDLNLLGYETLHVVAAGDYHFVVSRKLNPPDPNLADAPTSWNYIVSKISKAGNVIKHKDWDSSVRETSAFFEDNNFYLIGGQGFGGEGIPQNYLLSFKFSSDLESLNHSWIHLGAGFNQRLDISYYNGHIYSISANPDIVYLNKLDPDLNIVWQKSIASVNGQAYAGSLNDVAIDASSAGLYFTFNSNSFGMDYNGVIGKAGLNYGNISWMKNLSDKLNHFSSSFSDILAVSGNAVYILGTDSPDCDEGCPTSVVFKFALNGNLQASKTIAIRTYNHLNKGIMMNSGELLIHGSTAQGTVGPDSYWASLVTLDQSLNILTSWESPNPTISSSFVSGIENVSEANTNLLLFNYADRIRQLTLDFDNCNDLIPLSNLSIYPGSFTLNNTIFNLNTDSPTNKVDATTNITPKGSSSVQYCSDAFSPLGCDQQVFATAPTGLTYTIDYPNNQFILEWDQYPSATACMVFGNRNDLPNDVAIMVGDVNTPESPTSLAISINQVQQVVNYRWKVICGCSLAPLISSPFSDYSCFKISIDDNNCSLD